MSDDLKPNENPRPPKPGDSKVPTRGWLFLIAILGFLPLLFMLRRQADTKDQLLTPFEFYSKLEAGQIVSGTITFDPQSQLQLVTGRYVDSAPPEGVAAGVGEAEEGAAAAGTVGGREVSFRAQVALVEQDIRELQRVYKFDVKTPNTLFMNVFVTVILPFLLVAALIYFFFIRQIKMAGRGALSFGKSRARMLTKEKNKTTFKEVAGVEEAKEEVAELVDFLKDPKKFQRLGGRIPKGILMVGPPGTGKTLLAKAIAGEADAAFYSISGSDFVEMFVGVGASRVRDMFEQARKNTPCLIFIDEIDAVGRSRGVGLGGGNDEREQTLNALLVEMDGFDTQEGIIIIAATNRPDVLDPALLRPGRFDRQITVNLPDVKGREAILKVHARNVKLDPTVDLAVTARGTPGFSGAELANLLNEAALLAARIGKKAVGMKELEEARDKVRWGRERRSLAMTDEEKRFTAWHEAGHALVNVLLNHTHPLHKVTIIPRGQSLGSTMYLPERDVINQHRKQMLDLIAVIMAGRIAEELVSGDISTGASSDIKQATSLARSMVCQWGMSEKLGMVQYGSDEEYYLGRDMMRRKDYSEATAREIDEEVRRIIEERFQVARDIIVTHRDKLEAIAKALLEFETLEGWQVEEIVRTGRFTPTPQQTNVDPPSGAQAATSLPEVPKSTPPKLPGFGAPAPATA
jgi:cell division protease FtsH